MARPPANDAPATVAALFSRALAQFEDPARRSLLRRHAWRVGTLADRTASSGAIAGGSLLSGLGPSAGSGSGPRAKIRREARPHRLLRRCAGKRPRSGAATLARGRDGQSGPRCRSRWLGLSRALGPAGLCRASVRPAPRHRHLCRALAQRFPQLGAQPAAAQHPALVDRGPGRPAAPCRRGGHGRRAARCCWAPAARANRPRRSPALPAALRSPATISCWWNPPASMRRSTASPPPQSSAAPHCCAFPILLRQSPTLRKPSQKRRCSSSIASRHRRSSPPCR